ncbi:MAG: bifunctional diaminohydroxyphosphoribosylaminopyrimidine deaminase/5-amino-6-(5-phosphoribosylamino)uracil reductase RibD [Burkholderiales bacterium]|nr:MAG: bifunctional diaminohydroxyphosphoribosylaminopyrimidine deaminase/5-amino-6-(5-phosphoribosylamino)uracil reductase RibD [Burkholderiales bacterium]
MYNVGDHQWMARALELAREGLFTTSPNPRVGCVIVRDDQLIGEGWHRRAGEAHAEIVALAQAGERAHGATVYLTLEPCSHFGRTPPCVDALLEARVARIFVAMEDPNPLVGGRGLERLRAAGIDVRCGLLRQPAEALNIGFVSRMTRGRPWVRMKVAASLDGMTALEDGSSQWITGDDARRDGHAWRARACAVLTGIGTVREDDPQLDVRLVPAERQPLKVLVDSHLEVDLDARLLRGGSTLVFTAAENPSKERELSDRGVEVVRLPNAAGKVELPALLGELARREVNEVHVEAGFRLNGSLVREGCVDEFLLYLAPRLLGPGRGMFELPPLARLADATQQTFTEVERVGEDLRLLAQWRRE